MTPRAYPRIRVEDLIGYVAECQAFVSAQQIEVMADLCRGEEGDWFREKFRDLAELFRTMPRVYQQEKKAEEAIVHLHYFLGASDWWIIERDTTRAQYQAFGLADLYGDGGEIGYINIVELIRAGVELDLHWKPKKLAEVRTEREAAWKRLAEEHASGRPEAARAAATPINGRQ